MKKYYYSDGQNQLGPFDIEELKDKKITKETSVWFEGLTEWTKAEFIAELKDILAVTPPPFNKQTPPPIDQTKKKEEVKPKQTIAEPPKKSSTGKAILITLIVVLAIIGGVVMLNVISDSSNNTFMKVVVNPPNPRVVTQRTDEDPTSTLFSYKQGVDATIINEGGSGRIMVTCNLQQGDYSYQRIQEIYLAENGTEDLHFTFDEVTALGGQVSGSVTAKAIE